MKPLSLLALLLAPVFLHAAEPNYTRTEDVIYGRKYGTALTMDVFTPKEKPNGAGVVFCVSGGWFSSKESINPLAMIEFVKRGYVVFAVVHGSQPKFTIPEVLDDMHRAIRFIRTNAGKYKVDPDRLGITGGSAGGHLSLMMGTTGKDGAEKAPDPVNRASSKVAAVACFFPPTDFLNYGKEGYVMMGNGTLSGFKAPFDFHEMNPKTRAFDAITDEKKRLEIGKAISPVYHVTKSTAPTLLIHGDADKLVPLQQSELMIQALKAHDVVHELVIKKDGDHGWAGMDKDLITVADWFDKHTAKKEK
jgi:acetyl esterase/lipase